MPEYTRTQTPDLTQGFLANRITQGYNYVLTRLFEVFKAVIVHSETDIEKLITELASDISQVFIMVPEFTTSLDIGVVKQHLKDIVKFKEEGSHQDTPTPAEIIPPNPIQISLNTEKQIVNDLTVETDDEDDEIEVTQE